MGEHVITATDQTLQQEISQGTPALVDFWAEWCGPCRAVSPIVEELAAEYVGKVKILKLNVDDNQTTAQQYQIMSIPTLLFLKNGQPVDKIVGAVPKSTIKGKLDALLA